MLDTKNIKIGKESFTQEDGLIVSTKYTGRKE